MYGRTDWQHIMPVAFLQMAGGLKKVRLLDLLLNNLAHERMAPGQMFKTLGLYFLAPSQGGSMPNLDHEAS